jgi:hypothetical protein
VAAKLAVEKYGDGCTVVYCDTSGDEHPDNLRFLSDVEKWIGRSIERICSTEYAGVDDVIQRVRYMAGVAGARCTVELKKRPREKWQRPDDVHIFGYTVEERARADQFEDNNPALAVEWVLIDGFVTKRECLNRISEAGIEIPAMYRLGFEHNNCIGCVKATSAGYWNKVRKYFPEIFEKRARQSRLLGVKLARMGEQRVFLDDIPNDANEPDDDIDCGPVCQMPLPLGMYDRS